MIAVSKSPCPRNHAHAGTHKRDHRPDSAPAALCDHLGIGISSGSTGGGHAHARHLRRRSGGARAKCPKRPSSPQWKLPPRKPVGRQAKRRRRPPRAYSSEPRARSSALFTAIWFNTDLIHSIKSRSRAFDEDPVVDPLHPPLIGIIDIPNDGECRAAFGRRRAQIAAHEIMRRSWHRSN